MNNIINNNSQLEYDFTLSDDVYGMDYYNIIIIPDDKVYIFIIDSNYKGNTTTRFYSVPEIFSPEIIYPISLLNSIPTNIPTIIPTNMPTIIQNTIPTTFPTIFPTTIPITFTTTIPITFTSTIHTTFTTTFPTTIPTTILNKNIYTSIPSIILTTILPDSISNQKFSSTIVSSIYYKIETSQLSFSLSSSSNFPSTSQFNFESNIISETDTTLEKSITNKIDNFDNIEECSLIYSYTNIKDNKCEYYCSYNEFINKLCYINDLNENNIMNITQNIGDIMKNL